MSSISTLAPAPAALLPQQFSTRFVPGIVGESFNVLCTTLRAGPRQVTLSATEAAELASTVFPTGEHAHAVPQLVTIEALQTALRSARFETLSNRAAELRTKRPTGWRAPECFDRGSDSIQAALWILDELEAAASSKP